MATLASAFAGATDSQSYDEDYSQDSIQARTPDFHRMRFAGADAEYSSIYSTGSSEQAKKALEAHLAETDRRLADASRLGTVLVKQRKDLSERLKDVDRQKGQDDIAPELRQKLVALEQEVHEVSRESARTFISRSRVASHEHGDQSMLTADGSHSPTKIQAPSRKLRNQASGRVDDIQLMTDISQSLLNQVRELQDAYKEKEDALKVATEDHLQTQSDYALLQKRLRTLDENEQRFKDENWALETQVHELSADHKDLSDREQKLNLHLNTSRTQHATALREYEEAKSALNKLSEDHVASRKHHEVELAGLKREVSTSEHEKDVLQKTIEDLVSKNKELAKAISYRATSGQQEVLNDNFRLDDQDDRDGMTTPEHSPPGSPSKATPRHGALESETMKSSLNHAHRMIQNLKNNIHREKTEKLELKRMLQDARDDLENRRSVGSVADLAKRRKQTDKDVFKKPMRPSALGEARSSREDIVMDDEEWEEHDGSATPSKRAVLADATAGHQRHVPGAFLSDSHTSDAYNTATEQSDAFETADERTGNFTETDAFQTGAESLNGNSEDELTETEDSIRGSRATIRPSVMNRHSFLSTASMSGGEDLDFANVETPEQQPKYRMRAARNPRNSSSRVASGAYMANSTEAGTPSSHYSPRSINSNDSTPAAPGQSLFAELGDFDDVNDSAEATPNSERTTSLAPSPEFVRNDVKSPRLQLFSNTPIVRPEMVSTGTMTDAVEVPNEVSHHNISPEGVGAIIPAAAVLALPDELKSEKRDTPLESTPEIMVRATPEVEQSQVTPTFMPSIKEPQRFSNSPIHELAIDPMEERAITEPQKTVIPVNLTMSVIQSIEVEPEVLPQPQTPQRPAMAVTSSPSHVAGAAEILGQKTVAAPALADLMRTMRQEQRTDSYEAEQNLGSRGPKSRDAELKPSNTMLKPSPAVIPVFEDSTPTPSPLPADYKAPVLFGSEDYDTNHRAARVVGVSEEPAKPVEDVLQENPVTTSRPSTSERRQPFQAVDVNGVRPESRKLRSRSPTKKAPVMTSSHAQTMLTSEDIAQLLRARAMASANTDSVYNDRMGGPYAAAGVTSAATDARRARAASIEAATRRPGSSSSIRSKQGVAVPPLPLEAPAVIAAATGKAPMAPPPPPTTPGKMGPPSMPASAYKREPNRPQTPLGNVSIFPSPQKAKNPLRGSAAQNKGSVTNRSVAPSPSLTRRSSVSSFASELDYRFNIPRDQNGIPGLDSAKTDPRMIQAITQTMIGEWLWKYTRKAGREELSKTRHRRFFWVHPYTRTLYWSEHDPSRAGKAQLKAKSVAIEAVHMVNDENPMPPGLHRKSIVVTTPGRTIQFTATTAQRHETWFNALSYLLLRNNNPDGPEPRYYNDGEPADIDVAEFNPTLRSSSRMTGRSRVSNMSYASRHTAQPIGGYASAQPSMSGRISSLSGRFRSRQQVDGATETPGHEHVSHAGDSAEDLYHGAGGDGLENVRACCDGKHDVGPLNHKAGHVARMATKPSLSMSSRHTRNHSVGSTASRRPADPADVAA